MRKILSTTGLLVLALLTAGASTQGMPRGQSGSRTTDDRSPSMSRVQPTPRSDRDRGRAAPGRRDATPRIPASVNPPARPVPASRAPNLRPGVGTVPSGNKRADRGQSGGFLSLPASGRTFGVRLPSPPTRQPAKPPVVRPRTPPARKLPARPVRPPRPPRGHKPTAHKPTAYKPSWNRRTPFTPGWFKTRVPPAPPRRSARYHPWMREHPGWKWNHWWACANAIALTNWLTNRWARPVYYVYGTGGNVVYQDRHVYVDGAFYSTADDYYQKARAIALSVPDLSEAQAERLEWLPLGVFAITRGGVNQTNTYVQLSVTREGILGGTYFNEATGVSRPIEGMLDRDSQRAAWMFADGKNPGFVVETSFFNLSLDRVPVLVHFGPERTQVGLLLRTESPPEE